MNKTKEERREVKKNLKRCGEEITESLRREDLRREEKKREILRREDLRREDAGLPESMMIDFSTKGTNTSPTFRPFIFIS